MFIMRLSVQLAFILIYFVNAVCSTNLIQYALFHPVLTSSESRLSKRAAGCDEIPGNTYTWNMSTFNILCNTTFDHYYYIFIDYTPTFASCMENCVTFDSFVPCIGVDYVNGTYGYAGAEGGSRCYGLWNLTNGTNSLTDDSAAFQNGMPLPLVTSYDQALP
jgi:hypothetical protein